MSLGAVQLEMIVPRTVCRMKILGKGRLNTSCKMHLTPKKKKGIIPAKFILKNHKGFKSPKYPSKGP